MENFLAPPWNPRHPARSRRGGPHGPCPPAEVGGAMTMTASITLNSDSAQTLWDFAKYSDQDSDTWKGILQQEAREQEVLGGWSEGWSLLQEAGSNYRPPHKKSKRKGRREGDEFPSGFPKPAKPGKTSSLPFLSFFPLDF